MAFAGPGDRFHVTIQARSLPPLGSGSEGQILPQVSEAKGCCRLSDTRSQEEFRANATILYRTLPDSKHRAMMTELQRKHEVMLMIYDHGVTATLWRSGGEG